MPAVFISYRQTNDQQRARVRLLGEELRSKGLEVRLDQFFLDEHPGGPNDGWDKWSSDCALSSERVLIVGTRDWFDCFEKRQLPGTGLGAACEADDLRLRIYEAGGVVEGIRVVLFDDADAQYIPAKLKRYHRFHAERDLDNIQRWVLDQVLCIVARAGAAPPPLPAEPPVAFPVFKGLMAYGRKDAAWFFGREREIDEYLALLAHPQHQTLLLRGRSGVGKSSIMLAGVLPRLPGRRGAKVRHYLFMAAGADPYLELARAVNQRALSTQQLPAAALAARADALASHPREVVRLLEREIASDARRVLYIDQLEELLVDASRDAAERGRQVQRKLAFVQALQAFLDHEPARNVVAASLREDYAEQLAGRADDQLFEAITRVFERGMVRWLRLPDHDTVLDRMVQGPCERAGFDVQPELLSALRLDARELPGWPPLVNACLQEMVEQHVQRSAGPALQRRLTLAQYEAVGGLGEVIRRRARMVEHGLGTVDRALLPQLFERLVRIDSDTCLPTKDRLPASEVPAQMAPLVHGLLRERLLSDEGTLALAHDALFTGWPMLARWIERNREALLDRQDFIGRARLWHAMQRPERKLGRETDYGDGFGLVRPGAAEAARRDLLVHEWLGASNRQQLLRHLGVQEADPEVWRLPRLLRQNVRLSNEQLQQIEAPDRCFYYAMCPEAIPPEALPPPASASPSAEGAGGELASPAEAASSMAAQFGGGDDPSRRLDFFQPTHLSLTMGRTARYTLAHFAALAGQVDVLQRLLALGLDLWVTAANGGNLMHAAATGNQPAVAQLLLAQLPDAAALMLACTTDRRRTPLHNAAIQGHLEMVQLLLSTAPADAPLDVPDLHGWTALLMAAAQGHQPVVDALLASGRATTGHRRDEGVGAVGVAIGNNRFDLALHLVAQLPAQDAVEDAPRAQPGWSVLIHLIEQWTETADPTARGQIEQLMDVLLLRGADAERVSADAAALPLLALAAQRGALPLLKRLIQQGAQPGRVDARGWTALERALAAGQPDTAARLLDEADWPARLLAWGGDADGGPPSALQLAARQGLFDATERLAEALPAEALARHAPAPLIASLLDLRADDPLRLECGRVAAWLMAAGAAPPRWYTPAADVACRLVGLQPAPALHLALQRLPPNGWPGGPPVIDGQWQPMGEAAVGALEYLRAQGLIEAQALERADPLGARRMELPWYDDVDLAELALGQFDTPARWLLLREGKHWRLLDGTSPPLHALNQRRLRPLDAVLALEYLVFFCAIVHGNDGAFRVLRQPGRITWAQQADAALQAQCDALWRAPRLLAVPPPAEAAVDAGFRYECQMKYANALFISELQVLPSGMVRMLRDQPFAADLPVLDERMRDGCWMLSPRAPLKPDQRLQVATRIDDGPDGPVVVVDRPALASVPAPASTGGLADSGDAAS